MLYPVPMGSTPAPSSFRRVDESTRSITDSDDQHSDRVLIFGEHGASSVLCPPHGDMVVGRDGCDVIVADPSVSRRHARISLQRGVTIEDLGSANGTFIDGARLTPGVPFELREGQLVGIGRVHLAVYRKAGPTDDIVRDSRSSPSRLAAPGDPIHAVYELCRRLAPSDLSVLLLGETGVGKDVLAGFLHRSSRRAAGPMLRVNCAALPDALLESELFGHERGAFTGAVSAKPGILQAARGGTVLLDEIGDLPLAMQSKILRAVENREVFRVGASRPEPIDVRFLAATSRDVDALVAEGRLRPDLLFRLAAATVRLPPLRERKASIPALARQFLAEANEAQGTKKEFSIGALQAMVEHPWPGNVRELRHAISRSVLMSDGARILPEHLLAASMAPPVATTLPPPPRDPSALPPPPRVPWSSPPPPATGESDSLRGAVATLERDRIVAALERFGGNQTKVAEALGISRRTLGKRLDTFKLVRPRKTGALDS